MSKLLDKLVKIKAHMDSARELGNDHEAEAFALKLQQLLDEYKLAMTDLEWAEYRQKQKFGGATLISGLGGGDLMLANLLFSVVSQAYGVVVTVSRTDNWVLFGRENNMEAAVFIFKRLYRDISLNCHVSMPPGVIFPREWRKSFWEGCVIVLHQRLMTQKEVTMDLYEASPAEGTNTETALARVDEFDEVLQWVREITDDLQEEKYEDALPGAGGWLKGAAYGERVSIYQEIEE